MLETPLARHHIAQALAIAQISAGIAFLFLFAYLRPIAERICRHAPLNYQSLKKANIIIQPILSLSAYCLPHCRNKQAPFGSFQDVVRYEQC